MDVWWAKAVVLAGMVAMVAIRAPHGHRSRTVKVEKDAKGRREVVLLTIAWASFFLPIFWVFKPIATFADRPLTVVPWAIGTACFALGLWLFHRSHRDLGKNWSITLQLREGHALVTEGVYRRMRHPMYAALLLYSLGQALVIPNWVVGPSYLVAMGLLFALRLGPEERMMRERFGEAWDAYAARTKRILPGVW